MTKLPAICQKDSNNELHGFQRFYDIRLIFEQVREHGQLHGIAQVLFETELIYKQANYIQDRKHGFYICENYISYP